MNHNAASNNSGFGVSHENNGNSATSESSVDGRPQRSSVGESSTILWSNRDDGSTGNIFFNGVIADFNVRSDDVNSRDFLQLGLMPSNIPRFANIAKNYEYVKFAQYEVRIISDAGPTISGLNMAAYQAGKTEKIDSYSVAYNTITGANIFKHARSSEPLYLNIPTNNIDDHSVNGWRYTSPARDCGRSNIGSLLFLTDTRSQGTVHYTVHVKFIAEFKGPTITQEPSGHFDFAALYAKEGERKLAPIQLYEKGGFTLSEFKYYVRGLPDRNAVLKVDGTYTMNFMEVVGDESRYYAEKLFYLYWDPNATNQEFLMPVAPSDDGVYEIISLPQHSVNQQHQFRMTTVPGTSWKYCCDSLLDLNVMLSPNGRPTITFSDGKVKKISFETSGEISSRTNKVRYEQQDKWLINLDEGGSKRSKERNYTPILKNMLTNPNSGTGLPTTAQVSRTEAECMMEVENSNEDKTSSMMQVIDIEDGEEMKLDLSVYLQAREEFGDTEDLYKGIVTIPRDKCTKEGYVGRIHRVGSKAPFKYRSLCCTPRCQFHHESNSVCVHTSDGIVYYAMSVPKLRDAIENSRREREEKEKKKKEEEERGENTVYGDYIPKPANYETKEELLATRVTIRRRKTKKIMKDVKRGMKACALELNCGYMDVYACTQDGNERSPIKRNVKYGDEDTIKKFVEECFRNLEDSQLYFHIIYCHIKQDGCMQPDEEFYLTNNNERDSDDEWDVVAYAPDGPNQPHYETVHLSQQSANTINSNTTFDGDNTRQSLQLVDEGLQQQISGVAKTCSDVNIVATETRDNTNQIISDVQSNNQIGTVLRNDVTDLMASMNEVLEIITEGTGGGSPHTLKQYNDVKDWLSNMVTDITWGDETQFWIHFNLILSEYDLPPYNPNFYKFTFNNYTMKVNNLQTDQRLPEEEAEDQSMISDENSGETLGIPNSDLKVKIQRVYSEETIDNRKKYIKYLANGAEKHMVLMRLTKCYKTLPLNVVHHYRNGDELQHAIAEKEAPYRIKGLKAKYNGYVRQIESLKKKMNDEEVAQLEPNYSATDGINAFLNSFISFSVNTFMTGRNKKDFMYAIIPEPLRSKSMEVLERSYNDYMRRMEQSDDSD